MITLNGVILWIHILAAVAWIGGMIFVALVLSPLARRTMAPAERVVFFGAVGRRFSAVGWTAIGVLLATGTYNLFARIGSLEALLTTRVGNVLLIKLSLVAAMIVLSALHDFRWGPQAARPGPEGTLPAARRWTVLVAQANLLLGIAVLFLAVMLRYS